MEAEIGVEESLIRGTYVFILNRLKFTLFRYIIQRKGTIEQ